MSYTRFKKYIVKCRNLVLSTVATLTLWGASAIAQSWAERAQTESPICNSVQGAFQLCLIDNSFVAISAALIISSEDGIYTFAMDQGGFAQAILIPDEENAHNTYRSELGPRGTANNTIVDLGALAPWDYGSFTYSALTDAVPAKSPYIVSLLNFDGYDLAVVSWFPNVFQQSTGEILTDEQRIQHEHLLGAFRPITES